LDFRRGVACLLMGPTHARLAGEMSARAWTVFAAVSVLWGIPYLFIKVAVDGGVTPGALAWGRVVLGAVVLLAWAARSGTLTALRGHWRWLAAYAIVEISIPFPVIAAGEQRVPSSLAAISIAAVPLIAALLALRFDRAERVSRRRLVGLLTAWSVWWRSLASMRRADCRPSSVPA
jgi:drug/metabolite transporter (DMT)-like permease